MDYCKPRHAPTNEPEVESLVSVVIPTYNRSKQVVKAVRSVLDQTWKACEVIVVDDGSNDDTRWALEQFGSQVRYIKTKNHGVAAARNRGIREARGRWLAFLDSDDLWHPSKISEQLDALKKTGADVCFCMSVDEDGLALDDLPLMNSGSKDAAISQYHRGDCAIFLYQRHPFVQSMLVRKSCLKGKAPFDELLHVAEDTKLIHQLVLAHGFVVINQPLVRIQRRRLRSGLSDDMNAEAAYKRYDCYLRVQVHAYRKLLKVDGVAARFARRNMAYFSSRLAEIACALGCRDAAISHAYGGLGMWGGSKCLIRNLLVIAAYPISHFWFSRKWCM